MRMMQSWTILRNATARFVNHHDALRSTSILTSNLISSSSSRTFATRRRRRPTPGSTPSSSSHTPSPSSLFDNTSSTPITSSSMSEAYAPTKPNGEIMTMAEYNEFATLSPFVPVPDVVARKMLELTQAGPKDIHVELGSGDGRVNFHAIDAPYHVSRSTGIDVDSALIEMAQQRLGKRHPIPENIEFVQADLLSEEENEVKDKIATSTVLTMYFVEEALQKLKPSLETLLSANTTCRIVTCGYEMKGWKPSWVEVILGLPLYLYKMKPTGGPETMVKMEELEELRPVRNRGSINGDLPEPEEQALIPEGEDVDIDDDEDWDAEVVDEEEVMDDFRGKGSGLGGGNKGGFGGGWKSSK
uniref:Methyltransferase domain-containing protein n=2 Tax=Ditylum brightwellii TaxID=49249 RepID=A0A7S1ZJH4_9STRA